jgi:hypothetical protein
MIKGRMDVDASFPGRRDVISHKINNGKSSLKINKNSAERIFL